MINKEELIKIKGGKISGTTGVIVSAIVSFLIGVVDGYMRPIANTIVKVITTAMEFGRTVGTAIRRAINKSKC